MWALLGYGDEDEDNLNNGVHKVKCEKDLYIPIDLADVRRHGNFDILAECIIVEPETILPQGGKYLISDEKEGDKEVWIKWDGSARIYWDKTENTWAICDDRRQLLCRCLDATIGADGSAPPTVPRGASWESCSDDPQEPRVRFQVNELRNRDDAPIKLGSGEHSQTYYCGVCKKMSDQDENATDDSETFCCGPEQGQCPACADFEADLGVAFRLLVVKAPAPKMKDVAGGSSSIAATVGGGGIGTTTFAGIGTTTFARLGSTTFGLGSTTFGLGTDTFGGGGMGSTTVANTSIAKTFDIDMLLGGFGGYIKDKLKVDAFHKNENGVYMVNVARMTLNHIVRSPWLVDNAQLGAKTRGLSYRTHKEIGSKIPHAVAPWGTIVNGVDMGDGWLVVGEPSTSSWNTFLPIKVNGVPVLKPMEKPLDFEHEIKGQFPARTMLSGRGCLYQLKHDNVAKYDVVIGKNCKLLEVFPSVGNTKQAVASIDNTKVHVGNEGYLKLEMDASAGLNSTLILTACVAALRQLPAHDDEVFNDEPVQSIANGPLDDDPVDDEEVFDPENTTVDNVISVTS